MLRYTDLSPLVTAKHGETPAHVAAAIGTTECLKVRLEFLVRLKKFVYTRYI